MGIYLNPGNDEFYNAVKNSKIYVDKTEMLNFTNSVLGGEHRNICVSRPRRFGKSMAANMLVAYYSKGCDSRELFHELKREFSDVEYFEEDLVSVLEEIYSQTNSKFVFVIDEWDYVFRVNQE